GAARRVRGTGGFQGPGGARGRLGGAGRLLRRGGRVRRRRLRRRRVPLHLEYRRRDQLPVVLRPGTVPGRGGSDAMSGFNWDAFGPVGDDPGSDADAAGQGAPGSASDGGGSPVQPPRDWDFLFRDDPGMTTEAMTAQLEE